MFAALAAAALLAGLPAARPAPSQAETSRIRSEFRVFDGLTEVSEETRLRVRPAGSNSAGEILEGVPLAVDVAAGLYDVQAIRQRAGRVLSVRWAERLVIMPYPDEEGRHLEVINFAPGHGALQLRLPPGLPPDAAKVTVRRADGATVSAGLTTGAGYLLVVLPAGTYALRVTWPGRPALVLDDFEIPADRTRMTVVD